MKFEGQRPALQAGFSPLDYRCRKQHQFDSASMMNLYRELPCSVGLEFRHVRC